MNELDTPDLQTSGPTEDDLTADPGSTQNRLREARKQLGIVLEDVKNDDQRSVVRHQIADAESKLQRAIDQLEAIAAEEADD